MSITDRCDIIPVWGMDIEAWHKERSQGIGGSDIGTICGLNPFSSAYSLWAEKSGLVERSPAGEAARWGNKLEPVVAEAFAEDTGLALVEWPVILRSKEHPFMLANVDRFVVEDDTHVACVPGTVTKWWRDEAPDGLKAIYEGKTAGVRQADKWADGATPPTYELQTQWYLAISGLPYAVIGCLLGGQELLVRHIERDDLLIGDLIDIAGEFWDRVQTGNPPPVDASEATTEALKARQRPAGKQAEGGEQLRATWTEYLVLKATAEAAEQDRKDAYNRLVQSLGDAEIGLYDGEPLFTYKKTKNGTKLDEKRFAAERPDLYKEYQLVKPGYRVLRGV